MTKLPYDRLAAFGLGVMTTVLLLAPAGKAFCRSGDWNCAMQGEQLRQLEWRQNQMKYQLERQEREIQNQRRGGVLYQPPFH
jgi:hypothetical protein